MDVKLFSLCNTEAPDVEEGIKCIFDCVKSFFSECVGFSEFTSQKRMLLAISQSLRAADIVIVAVQGSMYNATKRLLCSALDIKLSRNPELAALLAEHLQSNKMKRGTYEANISFPSSSELLPTNDNINCGFAITSGGQHIIYMPVEAPRSQDVVFGSLYDYFSTLADTYVIPDAMRMRHTEIIDRTINGLALNEFKVAFADINGTDFIRTHVTSIKNLNTWFVFENEYSVFSDDIAKECAADTAQQVKNGNHADLGALISDVYTDNDNRRYSIIAIAEEKGTRCIKVFAGENETEKDFLAVCVEKLMLLIYEYLIRSSNQDCRNHESEGTVSGHSFPVFITASALALSSVVGLIIAFILK